MNPPSADTHSRRYLEARRACLSTQLDALRAQAQGLWNRAAAQLLAGGDPTHWERQACDAELLRRQTTTALQAIDRELGDIAEA